jgi:AraC-like DNA-binding protein
MLLGVAWRQVQPAWVVTGIRKKHRKIKSLAVTSHIRRVIDRKPLALTVPPEQHGALHDLPRRRQLADYRPSQRKRLQSGRGMTQSGLIRLSNHDVPARERLSYLHDFVARSVAGLQFTPRDADDFEFELTARNLGGTVVGTARYSAVRGERTRALTADGRQNYMMTIHDTDYEVEVAGGRRLQVSAGDIVIVNESLRQTFTLPGTELTAIVLDEKRMAEIAPDIRTQPFHHMPAAKPGVALVAGYARLLLGDASLDGAAARLAGDHLYQLAALALGGDKDRAAGLPGIGGARLALVKQDIAHNLADPEFDIAAVARRQGITPRYIQRLFERERTTFGEFLRDARLDRARAALEAGNAATISAIAFDCGFGDLSHFNKAFRQRFGATPSDIRARAMLGRR